MNQNTVTREECQIFSRYNDGQIQRLARAHLELLSEVKLEKTVRETAERESAQHAERTAQLYIERDELRSQKAALESQLAESQGLNKTRLIERNNAQAAEKRAMEQLAEARESCAKVADKIAQYYLDLNFEYSCTSAMVAKKIAADTRAIDAAGALRAKPEAWKPSDPIWPPK